MCLSIFCTRFLLAQDLLSPICRMQHKNKTEIVLIKQKLCFKLINCINLWKNVKREI